jgi:antirestriction protein ArdC
MLLAGSTDSRGYRQWQEVGRHVRKGERAHYILAPVTRKRTERDPETGEESERPCCVGFVGIPVFGIHQTDGFSIEAPDYRPATFPPLMDVAAAWGIRVDYAPFVARFRGYYQPGEDRILLCTHDARTFFHELGHAAHARVMRERGEELKPSDRAEVVAEVVAATLCKLYDVEAGSLAYSAEYVRGHAKGGNPGRAAMRVLGDVQACLTLILEGDEAASTAPVEAVAA